MRILFVDPILRTAETNDIPEAATIKESLPYNYAKALHDMGHEVVLIACADFRPSREEEYPFEVVFLPSRLTKLFPPRAIPFMPGLLPYLRDRRGTFDLVVCGEIVGIHTLMAAIVCPRRTVVWHELAVFHKIMGGYAARAWYRFLSPLYARVASIVPRSDNARRFLSQWFRKLCPYNVEHGVDASLFDPSDSKDDRFVVVARLVPPKRVDQILRSFAEHVRLTGVRTELWIVGDGPEQRGLELLADKLGIGERTKFLGRLPHARIAEILASSKALLYKAYYDNSLLTVAESIASGTPVLVTGSIDNADAVRRHRLGIARDEWDHVELAELESRHEEFARNCRAHRKEATVQWQASRLVQSLSEGTVPTDPATAGVRTRRPRLHVLSQNCFVACDLLVLPALRKQFDISWSVFIPRGDPSGHSEDDLRTLAAEWGIHADIVRLDSRMRSSKGFSELRAFVRRAKSGSPDLLYVNATGLPWLGPLVRMEFQPRRVLWALHDVRDHRDKGRWTLDAVYKAFLAYSFSSFHLLSRNQAELFLELHPGKAALYAPHPPLSYGPPSGAPPANRTVFLFFGFLDLYKGVDILIEAAQRLHERGAPPFEVVLAGRARDWESLRDGIRHPGLFRPDIRMIPNEWIPNLYAESHWLVLPYRDATQSGPLALAFEYDLPVIASDVPAFREFLRDGDAGILFPAGDVDGLVEALAGALAMSPRAREELIARQRMLRDSVYGLDASRDHYARMFRSMLESADASTGPMRREIIDCTEREQP